MNEERKGKKNKREAGWKPKDQRLLIALSGHLEFAPAHAQLRDCCCWFWIPEKMLSECGERNHPTPTTPAAVVNNLQQLPHC